MLGAKIRRAREEKDLTQEQFAELLEVSRQAVSKWELDQAIPTAANLERIEAVLGLPAGALTALVPEKREEAARAHTLRNGLLLGGAAVLLAGAFWMGRSTRPAADTPGEITIQMRTALGSAEGARVTLPVGEDGAVHLELPLSEPGTEERLARTLEFYAWPERLPLTEEPLIDFDTSYPLDRAEDVLPGGWAVELTASFPGGGTLGVVRTGGEDASDWLLARDGEGESWMFLNRFAADSLVWKQDAREKPVWAVPAGNVLGYDSVEVQFGEDTLVLARQGGVPHIVFFLTDPLQGFADLDLDGEREIVCRPIGGRFQIYDLQPDGYVRLTLGDEADGLEVPESMMFLFDPARMAFGFGYSTMSKLCLDEDAPVYDRLAGNRLMRRDGKEDDRRDAGLIDGTAVTFQVPDPDELSGWTVEGTPLPTPREQGAVLLDELESLTGYRPERCYIWGGAEWQYVSLEQNADKRTFFSLSAPFPDYYGGFAPVDNSLMTPYIQLTWQTEWAPWSPLDKENVALPESWDSWTEDEHALWWYERSHFFDCGEVVAAGPAQYQGVRKLTLKNGDFLEVGLDEEGYLTTLYGPYPNGTIH